MVPPLRNDTCSEFRHFGSLRVVARQLDGVPRDDDERQGVGHSVEGQCLSE